MFESIVEINVSKTAEYDYLRVVDPLVIDEQRIYELALRVSCFIYRNCAK